MNFPAFPSYRARWWPLYVEGIPGSGERLTFAIGAVGEDGQQQLRMVMQPEALRILFGPQQGGALYGMLAQCLVSMRRWSEQSPFEPKGPDRPSFQKFAVQAAIDVPMFQRVKRELIDAPIVLSNVSRGKARDAFAHDLDDVFEQAIRLSASTGASSFDTVHRRQEAEVEQASTEWFDHVRQAVLAQRVDWAESFSRPVSLSRVKRRTVIGFMRDDYAANLGVLRADVHRTSADMRALRLKLQDLDLLRSAPLLLRPTRLDLIVGRAPDDSPGMTRVKADNLKRNVEYIADLAHRKKVAIEIVHTPAAATEVLLASAA